MSPERWRRVEELYHAAMEQSSGQRVLFLEEKCDGDPELRTEVQSLLEQRTEGDRLLEAPAWQQAASLLPASPRLEAGTELGPYRILGLLGAGGMGEVYRAKDTRLGREVALKVLPQDYLLDPERRRRFLQEAKAASALNHPNIMIFHDLASANGKEFLVLENVAGRTLHQLIPRQGMVLRDALTIAVQIADALAAAHAAGVIHRDLKPANIMVSDAGVVKLLDFGLAKLVNPEPGPESGTLTTSGVILGTLSYMCPEQAEGNSVDARADLFSFGCVLYEMLTGQRAFPGDSPASIMSSILRDEPKPANVVRPAVPRELNRIVERCLRKDPQRRFQGAADLRVALLEVRDDAQDGPFALAEEAPRRTLLYLGLGLAVVVLLCGVGWLFYRSPPAAEGSLAVTPLTSYPGYELGPVLAPDGNQVAFEWQGDHRDNSDIYIKLMGSGEPLRLTTHPNRDRSPAWSPDGRSIAFLRELRNGKEEVLVIPALGGVERKVAETTSTLPGLLHSASRTVAWTPDGKSLVIPDLNSADEPSGLMLVSLATGEKRRLTTPPPTSDLIGDRSPAFSADGRLLVFSRTTTIQSSDLYLLRLTGDFLPDGEPQQLTEDHRWNDSPAWMDGGTEILFSSNRDGSQNLWRMSLSGAKVPRRLPLSGDNLSAPTYSREARRLVYLQRFQDANIWKLSLADKQGTSSAARMLVSSSRLDSNADYSPDGQRIVFQSDRSGNVEIWISDSTGAHARPLTSYGHGHTGTPRWSPDGKWIAFDSNVEGQYDIYLVAAEGGSPRRITGSPNHGAIPSWSRDSRWVYFTSGRGGQSEIWKVLILGGPSVQVTTRGGVVAAESADGRTLYYLKSYLNVLGNALWQMPVTGGNERIVLEKVFLRNFAPSKNGIFYSQAGGPGVWTIRFFSFGTKKDVAVGSYSMPPNLGLSLSPDGSGLLFTQIDQEGSDLMVAENFR